MSKAAAFAGNDVPAVQMESLIQNVRKQSLLQVHAHIHACMHAHTCTHTRLQQYSQSGGRVLSIHLQQAVVFSVANKAA